MGLYKTVPPLSGRMGALWCLSGIADSAVIEYGCMGHMAYGRTFLHRMGSYGGHLYSTHIGETDIAMGDTSRLSRAIEWVSEKEGIKTIFLLPSSVPEVIGVDLEAIAQELSPQFPDIVLIPFTAGGFDTWGDKGIEMTLLKLAETLPDNPVRTQKPSFNIIGSCADMFRFQADASEMARLVSGAFDMEHLCTMASRTSISKLEHLGDAHINLVVRREGEAAAKYLRRRYGTPYLMGRPYGLEGTLAWLEQIEVQCKLKVRESFVRGEKAEAMEQIEPMQTVLTRFLRVHREEARLILAGHADVVRGIEQCARELFGFETVTCYCDNPGMKSADINYLTDKVKEEIAAEQKGFLMGSQELLNMAEREQSLQISTPDYLWHHAYEPPFVGFRGAVHLASLWTNEMMRKD
ncbi:nitrogenase component 1 [Faecalicatena contorta]|uniref:Nitrogenase molybdenum-iron protein, alpha and beta chains n=1 Tax=Faecalicatena contorta TaxID=39482 RepID=A0A316A3H5_9FIRM|nr:nitrogenase component 1 [Faecalicatena contorta]PWJ51838.1 nitrogenase molybdenum-iron protein alpha/beta subunit [Faecalicatena contorta]SUQ12057.1 Nitrogenase molybdenum-iron protein, alpha and beta chains [Faecalicatena contorta]